MATHSHCLDRTARCWSAANMLGMFRGLVRRHAPTDVLGVPVAERRFDSLRRRYLTKGRLAGDRLARSLGLRLVALRAEGDQRRDRAGPAHQLPALLLIGQPPTAPDASTDDFRSRISHRGDAGGVDADGLAGD